MGRSAFASLLCLALATPAAAQVLAVEVRGPAVPCMQVEHVIERSQGALVARIGKFLPEGFGRREAVGLLTDDDLGRLVSQLDALGAFSLPSVRHRSARATYRVRLELPGGRAHSFEVADPGTRPDGRHQAVIDLLRRTVEAKTGPVEVQDDLLLPSEAGLLQVLTDVPARVVVVGEGITGRTPLRGLRLPVGRHVLEVTPEAGGEPTRYEVQVDVGRTTNLKVQLK